MSDTPKTDAMMTRALGVSWQASYGRAVEFCRQLERENAALRDFARDVRDNSDCDTGANGSHPHYCRRCNAAKLIGPKS